MKGVRVAKEVNVKFAMHLLVIGIEFAKFPRMKWITVWNTFRMESVSTANMVITQMIMVNVKEFQKLTVPNSNIKKIVWCVLREY